MRKKQGNGKKNLFFHFFNRWFVLGLFIICISCIISLAWAQSDSTVWEFFRNLIPNLLQTIGIAFMLGAVFDFSKNTQDFIELISLLLSDIVISKTFLSKLEAKGRSEALSLILRPSENQIKQYSRACLKNP